MCSFISGGVIENPDGSIEDMTDPDFWWAVLGGGGGVYGVVTQFVLKLHPAPDGFVEFYIQFQIADSGNCAGVATEVSIGADITSHAVPDICKGTPISKYQAV